MSLALNYYAYVVCQMVQFIYADKAYNDYGKTEQYAESSLTVSNRSRIRKKKTKRALSPSVAFVQSYHRKSS